MNLEMDNDVRAVAEFMQRHVPTAHLVGVAKAISDLAPLLWGAYEKEDVATLLLREHAPTADAHDPHTPQGASE